SRRPREGTTHQAVRRAGTAALIGGRTELDALGCVLLRPAQRPLVPEEHERRADLVLDGNRRIAALEVPRVVALAAHPPRNAARQPAEDELYAVYGAQPEIEPFELQCSDRAEDRVLIAHPPLAEDLNGAFLGELIESGLELLALERVLQPDLNEMLRREA